jgi:hypothetical protein
MLLALMVALLTMDNFASGTREVTFHQAKLRSVNDHWGQKLKLGWKWIDMETSKYELCVSCDFDATGKRVGDKGVVGEGGTCGGDGNGCYSIKGKLLEWGTTISINVRSGKGDGFFSPWGSKISYFLDPALNTGGVALLEPVNDAKEEL